MKLDYAQFHCIDWTRSTVEKLLFHKKWNQLVLNAFGKRKNISSAEREWLSLLKLSHKSTIETSGNESYLERQSTFGFTQCCWYRCMIHRFSQRNLRIFSTYVHTLQVKIKYTWQSWFLVDQILGADIEVLWIASKNLLQIVSREKPAYFWNASISRVIFLQAQLVTFMYDWYWCDFHLIT